MNNRYYSLSKGSQQVSSAYQIGNDEDTGAHIQRLSNYSSILARTMGLSEQTVEFILYAAPMHDIGKIGIPDRILLKPAKQIHHFSS